MAKQNWQTRGNYQLYGAMDVLKWFLYNDSEHLSKDERMKMIDTLELWEKKKRAERKRKLAKHELEYEVFRIVAHKDIRYPQFGRQMLEHLEKTGENYFLPEDYTSAKEFLLRHIDLYENTDIL